MQSRTHICTDRSVISLHSLMDPVEQDPDKTVLIKICNEILLSFRDGSPDRAFLHHAHDQIVGQTKKEVFDLLRLREL